MRETGAVKARKLILNGTSDDVERLEKLCERLAPAEFAAGGRLRALAVELARREELEVPAVAYEDESLELEVVVTSDRFRDPVSIGRDKTGDRCQVSWQRWADIGDDAAVEKPAEMIAAISGTCVATR
jgi:hypothetical protein